MGNELRKFEPGEAWIDNRDTRPKYCECTGEGNGKWRCTDNNYCKTNTGGFKQFGESWDEIHSEQVHRCKCLSFHDRTPNCVNKRNIRSLDVRSTNVDNFGETIKLHCDFDRTIASRGDPLVTWFIKNKNQRRKLYEATSQYAYAFNDDFEKYSPKWNKNKQYLELSNPDKNLEGEYICLVEIWGPNRLDSGEVLSRVSIPNPLMFTSRSKSPANTQYNLSWKFRESFQPEQNSVYRLRWREVGRPWLEWVTRSSQFYAIKANELSPGRDYEAQVMVLGSSEEPATFRFSVQNEDTVVASPNVASKNEPPPRVASLRATNIYAMAAEITWEPVKNVDGFVIQTKPYRTSEEINLYPSSTSFQWKDLTPSTQYTLRIFVEKNGMRSAPRELTFNTKPLSIKDVNYRVFADKNGDPMVQVSWSGSTSEYVVEYNEISHNIRSRTFTMPVRKSGPNTISVLAKDQNGSKSNQPSERINLEKAMRIFETLKRRLTTSWEENKLVVNWLPMPSIEKWIGKLNGAQQEEIAPKLATQMVFYGVNSYAKYQLTITGLIGENGEVSIEKTIFPVVTIQGFREIVEKRKTNSVMVTYLAPLAGKVIIYLETDKGTELQNPWMQGQNAYAQVTNLLPGQRYRIRADYTLDGRTNQQPIFAYTKPEAPQILSVESNFPKATVRWRTSKNNAQNSDIVILLNNVEIYREQNLQPGLEQTLTIPNIPSGLSKLTGFASVRFGDEQLESEVFEREIEMQPANVAGAIDLEVLEASSTSASIRWSPKEGYPQIWRISWKIGGSSGSSREIPGGETFIKLSNLKPFSSYVIDVVAILNGGESPKTSIQFETLEEAPKNFRHVREISSSSAEFIWDKFEESDINEYRMFIGSSEPSRFIPEFVVNQRNGLNQKMINGQNVWSFVANKLYPMDRYSVKLTGVSDKGVQKSETAVYNFQMPPEAISGLQVIDSGSDYLHIIWEDKNHLKNPSYRVIYKSHQGGSPEAENTSDKNLVLKGLVAGRDYDISVSAIAPRNSPSHAPMKSMPATITASTAIPKPSKIDFVERGQSELEVTWHPRHGFEK